MLKSTQDLLWALILILLSVCIFFYSSSFIGNEEMPYLAESSVYAKIWAIVLLLLALGLLIRSLKRRSAVQAVPLLTFGTILSVTALVLYLLALQYLGFVTCTVLFLTLLISYYHWLSLDNDGKKGFRPVPVVLRYLVLSVLLSFLFEFIFGTVLSIYLPAGTLIESLAL